MCSLYVMSLQCNLCRHHIRRYFTSFPLLLLVCFLRWSLSFLSRFPSSLLNSVPALYYVPPLYPLSAVHSLSVPILFSPIIPGFFLTLVRSLPSVFSDSAVICLVLCLLCIHYQQLIPRCLNFFPSLPLVPFFVLARFQTRIKEDGFMERWRFTKSLIMSRFVSTSRLDHIHSTSLCRLHKEGPL